MPSAAECAYSVENDTVTMAYLIGLFATHFPYAAAAARLASDEARELFCRLCRNFAVERPEIVYGIVEKRFRKRR